MSKQAQKNLGRWMTGRNPFLALPTAELMASPDGLVDALRILSQGTKEIERLRPSTPPHAWLRLYRDHRRMMATLIDLRYPSRDPSIKVSQFLLPLCDIARGLGTLSREEKEAVAAVMVAPEFHGNVEQITAGLNLLTRREWSSLFGDDPSNMNDGFEELRPSGILQFLVIVWLPCILLAHDYPGRLLRRARQGDIEALEHLLRIDKTILHDPRIAEQFRDAWFIGGRRKFDRMTKALAGKPKQLSSKTTKIRLAALASRFHQGAGGIDSPELRELSDILQSMHTKGKERIDSELPESPEAFAKAIQRFRSTWTRILPPQPDKKKK